MDSKLQRVLELARSVTTGWHMARGVNAHHIGCQCGGVFSEDANRVIAGEPLDDIHYCFRLDHEMEELRTLLDEFDNETHVSFAIVPAERGVHETLAGMQMPGGGVAEGATPEPLQGIYNLAHELWGNEW